MTQPQPLDDEVLEIADASVLLQRQVEVLELVASAAPLERTLNAIITSLEDFICDARCSILLLDSTGATLRHGSAPNLPTAYLTAIDGLEPGPRAGSCGAAAFLGEPVVAVDVRIDERWVDYRHLATEFGLVSCWSSPISDPQGATVGTFAVYHAEPHTPDSRERRLVRRFTYLASVAIEHSRLLGDLVESEELFRRSFEDNAAGEALLALDRTFERTNLAFTRLSGYPSDELVGCSFEKILHFGFEAEAFIETERAAFRTNCSTRQMVLRSKDGSLRDVEATISVIRSLGGTPSRLTLNLVDLTERFAVESAERARREADVARQIAEDHSNAKSALLTSVSHEIRTPLQAIKGFTELLSTLDLDKSRRQEALQRINFAADHLLELVTGVLDISRAEAGVLPLRFEPVELAGAVRETVQLLSSLIAERDVSIHISIGPDVRVFADRGRLRQVLINIVGNALRYGPLAGNVYVAAETRARDIVLEVIDDGPGIPAAFLPRMFTPFARADGMSTPIAPVDGYGLGLMLAHGLITAMNGRIVDRNSDDGGAVFTVHLPHAVHHTR
ncbi:ATP-binding protein [Rhodococcus sp. C3V]|uniref:sensor histidine kinase n=1 Tax=Rhodococcus sp. C3V TaxID=3034165 RepID=UPI0023E1212F|nr:ATP-binding protein [Rhodococcus sp. C3V]MDF3320118.1 ATP-binding protein [Rhodococcus sp. C3V]